MKKLCEVCFMEFEFKKCRLNYGLVRYCSVGCSGLGSRKRKVIREYKGMEVFKDFHGYETISPVGTRNFRDEIKLHIFIAEEVLGRRLPEGAVVHHIDGNRSNNAKDNLLILQNDGEHQRLHHRQEMRDKGVTIGVNSWCGICKKTKPKEEFSPSKKNPTGRAYCCKECYNHLDRTKYQPARKAKKC